uniref:Uncharacterized protein n=1 Tax=Anguilla anguilla TaxID=7936 RepID=A0A0E9PYU8_ANGAN
MMEVQCLHRELASMSRGGGGDLVGCLVCFVFEL